MSSGWDHRGGEPVAVVGPRRAGNFDSVRTDASGQGRTHNRQNEVATVAGATAPTYDANGSLTKDQAGQQYVYDAWDRLVKDSGGSTIAEYKYDGLGRRRPAAERRVAVPRPHANRAHRGDRGHSSLICRS